METPAPHNLARRPPESPSFAGPEAEGPTQVNWHGPDPVEPEGSPRLLVRAASDCPSDRESSPEQPPSVTSAGEEAQTPRRAHSQCSEDAQHAAATGNAMPAVHVEGGPRRDPLSDDQQQPSPTLSDVQSLSPTAEQQREYPQPVDEEELIEREVSRQLSHMLLRGTSEFSPPTPPRVLTPTTPAPDSDTNRVPPTPPEAEEEEEEEADDHSLTEQCAEGMQEYLQQVPATLTKAQRKQTIIARLQEDLQRYEARLQEMAAKPWAEVSEAYPQLDAQRNQKRLLLEKLQSHAKAVSQQMDVCRRLSLPGPSSRRESARSGAGDGLGKRLSSVQSVGSPQSSGATPSTDHSRQSSASEIARAKEEEDAEDQALTEQCGEGLQEYLQQVPVTLSKAQRKKTIMARMQDDLQRYEQQLQEMAAKPWIQVYKTVPELSAKQQQTQELFRKFRAHAKTLSHQVEACRRLSGGLQKTGRSDSTDDGGAGDQALTESCGEGLQEYLQQVPATLPKAQRNKAVLACLQDDLQRSARHLKEMQNKPWAEVCEAVPELTMKQKQKQEMLEKLQQHIKTLDKDLELCQGIPPTAPIPHTAHSGSRRSSGPDHCGPGASKPNLLYSGSLSYSGSSAMDPTPASSVAEDDPEARRTSLGPAPVALDTSWTGECRMEVIRTSLGPDGQIADCSDAAYPLQPSAPPPTASLAVSDRPPPPYGQRVESEWTGSSGSLRMDSVNMSYESVPSQDLRHDPYSLSLPNQTIFLQQLLVDVSSGRPYQWMKTSRCPSIAALQPLALDEDTLSQSWSALDVRQALRPATLQPLSPNQEVHLEPRASFRLAEARREGNPLPAAEPRPPPAQTPPPEPSGPLPPLQPPPAPNGTTPRPSTRAPAPAPPLATEATSLTNPMDLYDSDQSWPPKLPDFLGPGISPSSTLGDRTSLESAGTAGAPAVPAPEVPPAGVPNGGAAPVPKAPPTPAHPVPVAARKPRRQNGRTEPPARCPRPGRTSNWYHAHQQCTKESRMTQGFVSPETLAELLRQDPSACHVVDLREECDGGVLVGAHHIPIAQFRHLVQIDSFIVAYAKYPKIVFVCLDGTLSIEATLHLHARLTELELSHCTACCALQGGLVRFIHVNPCAEQLVENLDAGLWEERWSGQPLFKGGSATIGSLRASLVLVCPRGPAPVPPRPLSISALTSPSHASRGVGPGGPTLYATPIPQKGLFKRWPQPNFACLGLRGIPEEILFSLGTLLILRYVCTCFHVAGARQ